MFKNSSLKKKMLMAFTSVAAVLLIIGVVGFINLRNVVANYDHVVKINYPNAVLIGKMRASQKDVVIAISTLLGSHSTLEEVNAQKEAIGNAVKNFDEASKAYESSPRTAAEDDKWKETLKAWEIFKDFNAKLVSLSLTGSKTDEAERDKIGITTYKQARKNILEHFNGLIASQAKDSDKWQEAADSTVKFGNTLSISLVIAGFILAFGIGYFFSNALSRQLSGLASSLLESANSVAAASRQVSGAGSELSASTTEQAAALQETVASIEEVSAMVNKNADNAKRSQQVSNVSNDTVMKGKKVVETMIESIDDINRSNNDIMQQIETSNQQISDIVKVIAEIGNKTKVINDIVFQTKLLSFNASVEAARAGEHGKGFAVVAEEVGNLAQMSGNAAKEISQMLEGSIQKVEGIVSDTKSRVEKLVVVGKEKVQVGTSTAKRCGEVLDEIVKNVTEVNQMIGEISTASTEQAQGVQEINKAMGQMDQVTQQNASASQEVAGAAEQLTSQADSLRNYVQNLMHTVQGGIVTPGSSEQFAARHGLTNNVVSIGSKSPHGHSKKKPLPEQSLSGVVPARNYKKAVGSDIPTQDDPRFEDV